MKKSEMKAVLYNAICKWYDDNLYEYKGINDEEWVEYACTELGIDKATYFEIIGEELNAEKYCTNVKMDFIDGEYKTDIMQFESGY